MMKRGEAAADPQAYRAALSGWQLDMVEALRAAIFGAGPFHEIVKWTNLVYISGGNALLIRAEETRVLLGLWRGKRLRDMDARLKASGKYELANIVFREGDDIDAPRITELAAAAAALNAELGDPSKPRP